MMTEKTCEDLRGIYLEESCSTNNLSYVHPGKTNRQISVINETNREMLNHINHEVRTSMNAIMGFSQVLKQDDIAQDDRRSYATIICLESEKLLSTFNQILEMLKIQSSLPGHLPDPPDYF